MLKNFIKIAWRNLLKNKVYSTINIMGLAFGMAVAMLIGLWLMDELTFNHYFTKHKDLAQVMVTQTFNGQTGTGHAIAIPLANELRTKYGSNFKNVTLASWNQGFILSSGEKKISKSGMWVQPAFPGMLGLHMIEGNITALNDQLSVLISQSTAYALYGDANPIDKTIKINNRIDLKVGGVYEDIPRNATFYDTYILMSWDKYLTTEKWLKDAQTQWENHSFQMFVEKTPSVNFDDLTKKLEGITRAYAKDGNEHTVFHPMDRWRLYDEFENGKVKGGRISYVWMFGIIGVFVLLLACINFMNLSTARSEKRSKEVGVRKAIGSLREQIIVQFLSESMIMALIAFVLSIVLVLIFLPFFNEMADKQMHIPFGNIWFWLSTLLFILFTGLVSGSYPAFYLSSFSAVKVLKGTFKAGRYSALPRQIMVVLQFAISVALIIGTIIVFRQIEYAKDRPVGYSREGLITIMMNTPDLFGHYDAIRNDLLQTFAVENMAESSSPTTGTWSNQIGFDWAGKDPSSTPLFGTIAVTADFGKTINWHVLKGRDFSRTIKSDTACMVINESAVKLIGFKDPVGKPIKFNGQQLTIIGVIGDMVMDSPYFPVQPTVFFLNPGWANVVTIKIKPAVSVPVALDKIGNVFRHYNPGSPFNYKFTDQDYADKFADEMRIGKLASFFAVLAVFISSLGLFGLASFVAEQRTKEIGVRKVLGASVGNLWAMLSKEFVILVSISCLIAIPLAWYYLYTWLKGYKYHTEISWWVFAVACLGAMVITLLTISVQAIKAASANPVKSLRSE
jgi:ABC-type antimicrobial peptide transport system permease subunit